jgi:hypothetical protein
MKLSAAKGDNFSAWTGWLEEQVKRENF